MRRDRPAVPEQPGFAFRLGLRGSPHPRSAAEHAFPLTEGQPRSRISGVYRTHLGNVGLLHLSDERRCPVVVRREAGRAEATCGGLGREPPPGFSPASSWSLSATS